MVQTTVQNKPGVMAALAAVMLVVDMLEVVEERAILQAFLLRRVITAALMLLVHLLTEAVEVALVLLEQTEATAELERHRLFLAHL